MALALLVAWGPILATQVAAEESHWSCSRLYESCMRNTDLLKDDPEAYRKGSIYCLELYDDCLDQIPDPEGAEDPTSPNAPETKVFERVPLGGISMFEQE
jgi:hypothetical protein